MPTKIDDAPGLKQRGIFRNFFMNKKYQPDKIIKRPEAGNIPESKFIPKNSNTLLTWVLLGVIVLVTYITFYPALKNNFTNWDDHLYVVQNPSLAKPIPEGAIYFFHQNYFAFNYHPLTMIVYSLEYHIAKLNPHFYHSVNIFIHLVNVILVFFFIWLLSGKKTEVAAIVSLLFGIHPMHVESVAWISELKDVLYTFFFLGGLIIYYKYIKKEKKSIGSLLFYSSFHVFRNQQQSHFPCLCCFLIFTPNVKLNR